jgi:hypothetical protein
MYATVHKERKHDRVVSIRRSVVPGDEAMVEDVLRDSVYSRTINASFVERRHRTDRGRTRGSCDGPIGSARNGVCMRR